MAVEVKGKVSRIYPDAGTVYFQLRETIDQTLPKDGYFKLAPGTATFAQTFALLHEAATKNRYVVIRTKAEIVTSQHAEIMYAYVDFS